MKTYRVRLPVIVSVGVLVEVGDDDGGEVAIRDALENFEGIKLIDPAHQIEEVQVLRRVVEGNVFYGHIREAEAELER